MWASIFRFVRLSIHGRVYLNFFSTMQTSSFHTLTHWLNQERVKYFHQRVIFNSKGSLIYQTRWNAAANWLMIKWCQVSSCARQLTSQTVRQTRHYLILYRSNLYIVPVHVDIKMDDSASNCRRWKTYTAEGNVNRFLFSARSLMLRMIFGVCAINCNNLISLSRHVPNDATTD